MGLRVVVIAAVVALGFTGCGGEDDSSEGDAEVTAALDALAVATDGVENTDSLIDSAEQLAQGKPVDTSDLDLTIPEPSSEVPVPIAADLAAVANEQRKAAQSLEGIAVELDDSKSVLAKADNDQALKLLKAARQHLDVLRAEAADIEAQFLSLVKRLDAAITEIRNLLRDADALDADNEQTIAKALTRLQERPKQLQGIGKALAATVEARITALTTRENELSGPPPVTGPADCGTNSSGAQVVVLTGTIACEEAIYVSENSSFTPMNPVYPAGWTCGDFPTTLEGEQLPHAAGGGACTSDSGVQISVYDPNAVAPTDDGGGPPDTQAECEASGGVWIEEGGEIGEHTACQPL